MTRHTAIHAVNMAQAQDPSHRPPGFYAVVCTPAPLVDQNGNVLDALRPVVASSRGGVLINAPSRQNRGCVLISGRLRTGEAVAPTLWIGPLYAAADVEVLADWLAIGGPLAPVPDRLLELRRDIPGAAHVGHRHAPPRRSGREERR